VRASLPRFLLVGGTTVLIDLIVYRLLLVLQSPVDPAKALAFITGAVFAYFANWRFTFRGQHHRWSVAAFVLVYLCALGCNVLVNGLVLDALPADLAGRVILAFVVATGLSASVNYAGMALLVFRTLVPTSPSRR